MQQLPRRNSITGSRCQKREPIRIMFLYMEDLDFSRDSVLEIEPFLYQKKRNSKAVPILEVA